MFRAHVLIVRRAKIVLYSLWYHHTYRWPSGAQVERVLKLYYTVSGIITRIGGCPVHRLREDSLNLCNGRPPTGVMIPETV